MANTIKDRLVGWTKDFIYGSQAYSSESEVEEHIEAKKWQRMQVDDKGKFCKSIIDLFYRNKLQREIRVRHSSYQSRPNKT